MPFIPSAALLSSGISFPSPSLTLPAESNNALACLTDSLTAPTYQWLLRFNSAANKWYGQGPGWGMGTALPSLAAKLDRVPYILTDSLSSPTYQFPMIYSAGANGWMGLGGGRPLAVYAAGSQAQGGGSGQADLTGLAEITVPFTGTWHIEWGFRASGSGTGAGRGYLVINGGTQDDSLSVGLNSDAGFVNSWSTALTATHIVKQQQSNSWSVGATFSHRRIEIYPTLLS